MLEPIEVASAGRAFMNQLRSEIKHEEFKNFQSTCRVYGIRFENVYSSFDLHEHCHETTWRRTTPCWFFGGKEQILGSWLAAIQRLYELKCWNLYAQLVSDGPQEGTDYCSNYQLTREEI